MCILSTSASFWYRMTVAELMKFDQDLFCKLYVSLPTHALNHLFPPARNCNDLKTVSACFYATLNSKNITDNTIPLNGRTQFTIPVLQNSLRTNLTDTSFFNNLTKSPLCNTLSNVLDASKRAQ